jgi:superfamily II DNA or RNA helicase
LVVQEREAVQFVGDRMKVRFDRFDISAYRLFLRCKALPEYSVEFHREDETYTVDAPARFASILGVEAPKPAGAPLPLCKKLYDDQAELVLTALEAKRFAIWSGCGNGKTPMGLEWARQVVARTGGRVLIVTFKEIVRQWLQEAAKFYGTQLQLQVLETREEMRAWCLTPGPGLAITNYEKFNAEGLDDQVVDELRHLAGLALDESSRLKTGGGKQKWAIIRSAKGIEYKLSLTATPAPNDLMEFASQAAFLEKMRSENDIIWTFFTRDPQTQEWTVKPHARRAFFEWMSSWSIYVNDPKRYGWRRGQKDVPRPEYFTVPIRMTDAQRKALAEISVNTTTGQADLFGGESKGIQERSKLSQIAKGFRYVKDGDGRRVKRVESLKPAKILRILKDELKRRAQVLVWTVFDEEVEILKQALKPLGKAVGFLTGETDEAERVKLLEAFREGTIRILVSRPRMLGYGMNFQFCGAMVFSGWTDSFEDLYQAVRRAYRHGQQESVRVYFPIIPELEGDVFDNIRRKEAEFERSIAEMEEAYIAARARLKGLSA